MTKIFIASDHGGYELKDFLKDHLAGSKFEVSDLGCDGSNSVDYPEYANKLCNAVAADVDALGILICGTGIGMSMAANRHADIRAALCSEAFSAKMTRRHNNANVLCLGGRVIGPNLAADVVDAFLSAEFEGDRHQRRIDMFCCKIK